MFGSRISNNQSPNTTSRIEGGSSTLGDEVIKTSKNNPMRESKGIFQSIIDVFKAIPSKLSALKHNISEYFEGKAKDRAAEGLGKSIKGLTTDILSGTVTTKTLDNLASAMKFASRIDKDNAGDVVVEAFGMLASEFSASDIDKLARTDFKGLKAALGKLIDEDCQHSGDFDSIMNKHTNSKGEGRDWQDVARERKQALNEQISVLCDGVSQARFQKFEELSKGMMKVDSEGFISGSGRNLEVPHHGQVRPGYEVLQDITSKNCKSDLEGVNKGKPLPTVGGLAISHKAMADFPRMRINLETPNGDFVQTRHSTDHVPDENQIANALRHIAGGNDTAAFTLSTMLTQHGWTNLATLFPGSDGQAIPLRTVVPGIDEHVISTKRGDVVLNKPGQISEAVFNVTKRQDGNFSISVDWTLTSSGFSDLRISADTPKSVESGKELPKSLNVMSTKFTAEVVLSKAKADLGEIEFIGQPQFNVSFSGRVGGSLQEV